MKPRLPVAGLLLVLLLGSAHSAQFPSAQFPLPPNPSTIEGIVVDAATGKPLAGLTVIPPWPSSWPPPPPNLPLVFPLVQTDADGHFVRDNIFGDNGRASVDFLKTNEDFQFRIFTIAPGQRLSNVLIRLQQSKPRTGLVTGHVVDESGKGAANVEVALYPFAPINRMYSEMSARTDDRGEFRLYGLKPRRYIVGYSAGRTMIMLNGPPPKPSSIPAVLYPGVAEVSRAEVVNVENGKEIRLKEMVIGPVRMGKLRVHILNRGEPAKEGIIGTGDGMRRVHIDAGADFWEEYSPNGPGPVSFGVRWTDPGSRDSEYSTSIDFDGADRSLEVDLSRVHGVLSVRTFIDHEDGSIVPFTANTRLPIGLKSRTSDGAKVNTRSSPSDLVDEYNGTRMAIGSDANAEFTDLVTGSYNLDRLDLPPELYLASARQGDRDALEDGIDIYTMNYADPDFIATFKERAFPITIEENGQLTRDLNLIIR